MWFNSTTNEEPYQGLTSSEPRRNSRVPFIRNAETGAAWLSSARGVSCWVNSYNKRNPYRVLFVSHETAVVNTEEGGDDVKSAWPSDALGDTHVTMGSNKGSLRRKALANPIKPSLSSDWRLQLASMKLESLVTVGQPYHGEYVLGSCTRVPGSD